MHCMRCHGLMAPDHLFDMHGVSGHIVWRPSRRCMNCGHVDDAGIACHPATDSTHPVALSSEPDYRDEEVHLGRESYLARNM